MWPQHLHHSALLYLPCDHRIYMILCYCICHVTSAAQSTAFCLLLQPLNRSFSKSESFLCVLCTCSLLFRTPLFWVDLAYLIYVSWNVISLETVPWPHCFSVLSGYISLMAFTTTSKYHHKYLSIYHTVWLRVDTTKIWQRNEESPTTVCSH